MSEPDCETFFATLHQTLRVLPQADLDLVKDKPYAGQPYEYSKLESSRSIRLLKISHHGPFSLQEPQFSLVHTTIDIAPTYETLSYVWYTQIRGSTLTLKDGSTLRVTKNLKRALPYIARHCMTGYIWIDQICIAQDDVLEKNHQVSVMRDIYSGCCCVIVWLAELSMSPMPSAELEMAFRNSTALGWGFLPNRAEHFESFREYNYLAGYLLANALKRKSNGSHRKLPCSIKRTGRRIAEHCEFRLDPTCLGIPRGCPSATVANCRWLGPNLP